MSRPREPRHPLPFFALLEKQGYFKPCSIQVASSRPVPYNIENMEAADREVLKNPNKVEVFIKIIPKENLDINVFLRYYPYKPAHRSLKLTTFWLPMVTTERVEKLIAKYDRSLITDILDETWNTYKLPCKYCGRLFSKYLSTAFILDATDHKAMNFCSYECRAGWFAQAYPKATTYQRKRSKQMAPTNHLPSTSYCIRCKGTGIAPGINTSLPNTTCPSCGGTGLDIPEWAKDAFKAALEKKEEEQ